jgi:hypothetical protein
VGDHTIRITVREDRHERSSDHWVMMDGFQVGEAEMRVVDDVPGQGIEYTGSGWKHSSSNWERASGGSLTWTNHPGDAAEYRFEGNAITWVGKRCPACGQADVYVDGVLDTTVETYLPDQHPFRVDLQGGWQTPVYQRSWSEKGRHTLRIVVKPDRNMLSTGHRVFLDSLQVSKE